MTEVLAIDQLALTVPSPEGPRQLLHEVSFSIAAGESVGLVGESGSGKSLTARSVIGLLPVGSQLLGDIRLHGTSLGQLSTAKRRALTGTTAAMVFQDPRAHINPVRQIGDHLTEALRFVRKMSADEARVRAIELLEAVNFDKPERLLSRYPHELSGGMLQRVMIAGALSGEPSLLLADEPTTALDMTTQAEVMGILADLQQARGLAILFITHDLELTAATCDRTVVMYAGSVIEEQPSQLLQRNPRHPYSSALLQSRPSLIERQDRLPTMPGRPISAAEVSQGCPFASRCPHVLPECQLGSIAMQTYPTGRVACLRADELSLAGSEVEL